MESTTPLADSDKEAILTQEDVSALPAFEHTRYSGAGVLIFAYSRDSETSAVQSYILIGQERKGAYDDFGGGRGKGERHPILTAAREFSEESIGVICSREDMKNMLTTTSTFVYDSNFYQFWVKMSLDATVPEKFLKAKTEVKGKQQLRWIAVSQVRRAILEFKQRKPSKSNATHFNPFKQPLVVSEDCVLRKLFVKKMLRAEELGLLEQLEKCDL